MENNTPTMNVGALDQAIGSSYDSSFTTDNNLSDEPQAIEPVQDEPAQQATEPETTSEQGLDNKSEVEDSYTTTPYDELPDELKPLHKSLQADYTRKRQLERQQIKDLEAKLKDLESRLQNPNQTTDNKVSNDYNDEFISEEDRIRNYIKAEREAEWEKQAVRDITNIDNRLDDNHPEYDKFYNVYAREQLENSLEDHITKEGQKIGFDYKNVIENTSKEWKEYLDNYAKAYIARQNEIMKKNVDNNRKLNPETKSATVERSGKMSIEDAVMSALSK